MSKEMDGNDKGIQLLDDFWRWRLDNSPEFATFCGIHDFDDKLETYTFEDILERKGVCKKFLNDCQQILNETGLKKEVGDNLDFLVNELKFFIRGTDAKGYFFPLNYMEGPHLEFERLIASMNTDTMEDFNKILARYKELPVQMSQMIEIMREGIKEKLTYHKISVKSFTS